MRHATQAVPAVLADFLRRSGLLTEPGNPEGLPLTGGVSSEIWLVRAGEAELVVKQPLEELKVGDWHAPLTRSRYEAEWLRVVGELVPGACPRILASDPQENLLAMEYLEPESYPVWKSELFAGRVDPGVATGVGDRLGRIHRMTAARPELAQDFDTSDLFAALRIQPYLEYTGARHPDLAPALERIAARTLSTRLALVHGDVSPKNILAGPNGPVFLDAECAWWGDPAFDLAFCLNHLMLKYLVLDTHRPAVEASYDALLASYLPHVEWESRDLLLSRTAELLPALLLARVDGRSPAEYLTPAHHDAVREFATPIIHTPLSDPRTVFSAWKDALS